MATIQLGGGVASIRGSIGGWVFSRNAGGDYIRNRAVPIQPGSSEQNVVKALMSQLTNVWSNTLTDAQRDAWNSYAAAVELPNSQGIYRNVGGLGMFVRSNLPRLQASPTGLPLVSSGPTIFNLGDYTAPLPGTPSAATQDVAVGFTVADDWVDEDDAAMFVYASRPQNPAVNFFKGPYRLAGFILGDSVTPPTSPDTISLPFTFVSGQKIFFRFNVTRGDGRLGSQFRDGATAGA